MLGIHVLSGAFAGFSTAAMALVATQVPEGRLGYALGWLSTGRIAGALIGPLIGGLLADRFHDDRMVFAYSSGVTMLLVAACVAFVHEERATSSRLERLRDIARHRDFAPMFLVIMLAQICSIGLTPVLPLFVSDIVGNIPYQTTITGAAIAVTGVAGLLSAPFLGRRSDEIGYHRVLLIALAGATAFTLPQAFVSNIWAFVTLRFGVGVFLGGILPSANAIIGRIARPETRGQVYGFTATAQFVGHFIGPLLGSAIAAAFGIPATFAVIGLPMLANLVWVSAVVCSVHEHGRDRAVERHRHPRRPQRLRPPTSRPNRPGNPRGDCSRTRARRRPGARRRRARTRSARRRRVRRDRRTVCRRAPTSRHR